MKLQISSSLMLMSAMMGVAGCGGNQASTNSFVTLPSDGTGGTGGGTGGSVSSVGLYVTTITQDQPITNYLHQFGNFNAPCSITTNAASTDMQCILNAKELDIFTQGLKFDFNAAPGMCEYVSDTPYFYFNRQAGVGVTSISFSYNENSSSGTCTVKNGTTTLTTAITGETCTFPGGTASADGQVSCLYDYTASGGPNCCEGTYNYTGSLTTTGATSATVVNKVGSSWGGNSWACIASPAMVTGSGWKYNSTTSTPSTQFHFTNVAGLNQYYTIKAPIYLGSGGNSNVFAANFWDWTSYAAGALNNAALPVALTNAADINGNFPKAFPNPAYEWDCLDAAFEVKHRVRVYVNEWDTAAAFNAYGSSSGVTTNSPINTTTSCGTSFSEKCDDVLDWEDSAMRTSYPNEDLTVTTE